MPSFVEGQPHPRYVVVTGAVAAGASTLAAELANVWSADTLLEDRIEQTNPFFGRAQADPMRWGLANQAHFLTASVARHERLRAMLNVPTTSIVVEDRTPFEHTGAYVEAMQGMGILPADEADLLQSLGADLASRFVIPGLLVYREMTDDQLVERVATRGRQGESADVFRLRAILAAFEIFIDRWDRGPLVRIPADVDVLTDEGLHRALFAISAVWTPPAGDTPAPTT